jgi:RecB family exonuclease
MDGDELTAAFLFSQLLEDGKTKLLTEEHFEIESRRPSSARNAIAALYWAGLDAELPISIERHPATKELLANLDGPRQVSQARARVDLKSPLNGYLGEHVLAGTLKIDLPEHFSASQLGDFGKCPFKYWLSRSLKIELPVEPQEGLTPMERGTLYHRALEIFYAELIAKDQAITDLGEERGALAVMAIEKALNETESQPHFRAGEFWHYQKQEIIFRLTRFIDTEYERALKQNQRWKPVAVEATFGNGKEGASPPLRLRGGAIAVRGQIDRIDRAFLGNEPTNQFRVVDYKTGSARISAEDHNEGRTLQLPLYAMAIEKAIMPGAKVEEGEYLSVSSGEKIGALFPSRRRGEDPDAPPVDVLGQSEALINSFVEAIGKGQFVVNPSNPIVCKSCDHKPVCRIAEMAFEEEFSG